MGSIDYVWDIENSPGFRCFSARRCALIVGGQIEVEPDSCDEAFGDQGKTWACTILHQDGATVQGGHGMWDLFRCMQHMAVEMASLQLRAALFCREIKEWHPDRMEVSLPRMREFWSELQSPRCKDNNRERGRAHERRSAWGTLSEIKWWNNVLKRGFLPDKGNLADCCVWTCLNAFDGNINIISFRVLNHKHS